VLAFFVCSVCEFLFVSLCQLIGNISFHVFQFESPKTGEGAAAAPSPHNLSARVLLSDGI